MDKRITAALADELLTIVIHRLQLPGSKIQLKMHGMVVDILVDILRQEASIDFPDDMKGLVEDVVDQMPAAYGMVPHIFYDLRNAVENALSQDLFLKCVVTAHSVHGDQAQLDDIKILKNPNVPQEVKDEMLDHGIFMAPNSELLLAAATLIKELSDNPERDLLYIAQNAYAAEDGDELQAAVVELVANGNPERLANAPHDFVGGMELTARIDYTLSQLYCHHLHQYYDKGEK